MSRFFAGQVAHVALLTVLLLGLWALSHLPGFFDGEYLGLDTRTWAGLAVADAVAHQVFVWLCWRLELGGKRLTRWLGGAAFPLYALVFSVLILARPALITGLAIANANTLPADPTVALVLAGIAVLPAAYTMYSVARYFGFKRAYGIDHFDESYREMGLVKKGVFHFSSNAMYTYAFLALWIPGLALRSTAALALALFSHAYIWVHYFCTEKPDLKVIYSDSAIIAP